MKQYPYLVLTLDLTGLVWKEIGAEESSFQPHKAACPRCAKTVSHVHRVTGRAMISGKAYGFRSTVKGASHSWECSDQPSDGIFVILLVMRHLSNRIHLRRPLNSN